MLSSLLRVVALSELSKSTHWHNMDVKREVVMRDSTIDIISTIRAKNVGSSVSDELVVGIEKAFADKIGQIFASENNTRFQIVSQSTPGPDDSKLWTIHLPRLIQPGGVITFDLVMYAGHVYVPVTSKTLLMEKNQVTLTVPMLFLSPYPTKSSFLTIQCHLPSRSSLPSILRRLSPLLLTAHLYAYLGHRCLRSLLSSQLLSL
jgi:hypothetical protein